MNRLQERGGGDSLISCFLSPRHICCGKIALITLFTTSYTIFYTKERIAAVYGYECMYVYVYMYVCVRESFENAPLLPFERETQNWKLLLSNEHRFIHAIRINSRLSLKNGSISGDMAPCSSSFAGLCSSLIRKSYYAQVATSYAKCRSQMQLHKQRIEASSFFFPNKKLIF